MRKKVFLSGSFKTKEEERFLRDIYDALHEEYDVWWAHVNIERGYGVKDESVHRKIVETEKMEVRNRDAIVAVMRRPTFGTWGEVIYGNEHGVPTVAYLLPLNSGWYRLSNVFGIKCYSKDFESVWFPYHVKHVVYNKEDLLNKLGEILG